MSHLFTHNSSISTLYVTNELLSQIIYFRVQKLKTRGYSAEVFWNMSLVLLHSTRLKVIRVVTGFMLSYISVKVRQLMEALLERAETAKCVISLTPLAALNGDESPHFTHLMTSVKRSTHQT